MAGVLRRVVTAVQLTRINAGFGAVCDIWFVTVLSHLGWTGGTPSATELVVSLAGGFMVAVGLFGYGSVLNDLMDVRHDRTFSPGRPLPAGDIRVPQAAVGLVGLIIIAILGAMLLGPDSVFLTLIVAAALVFYNATGRFIPAVGIVTVGLVYAVHMLIPDFRIPLLLAVWLIMSHVMILAALVHLLEDKRPRVSSRGIGGITCGWLFWSAAILLVKPLRGHDLWPEGQPSLALLWPCGAMLAMAFVGWWKIRTAGDGQRASERLKRYGAAWHAAYAASWFAALGLWGPAACFLGLGLVGFTVMTVLRDLSGLGPGRLEYR
ncbi:MAG: UbiA family prenyltransferase [Phycisphaerales bacterium]|nr:UbiA family prenyltransferase [Phycisphaerales bacterium]